MSRPTTGVPVGPGSEVVVPSRDPNGPKTDTVALFGAIAPILGTLPIIVVVTQ